MSEPEVTEADREKAEALIADIHSGWCAGHPEWQKDHPGYPCHCRLAGKRDALATALAAERAKAREPFVSLLTLCDAVGRSDHPHAAAYAAVASDIRRAAEESQ